jgi:hypothetical protein
MNADLTSKHEIDQQYAKQKEACGGFATFAWIGSGILLLFLDEKFTLLSWQSLMFFIVGPFIAALLLGWVFYGTQRGLAKALTLFVSQPSSGAAVIVGLLGVVLTILHAVVAFIAARYTVVLMT